MMLTGLGPGEALGLGWEHLDLDASSLRLVRTLECKGRTIVDDTKRESRKRAVPIVPELRSMLRERWMAAGRPAAGLAFATRKGEHPRERVPPTPNRGDRFEYLAASPR